MSCNIYADAGFKDPELWLQKGLIVSDIRQAMLIRKLTPSRAAKIAGMPTTEFREMIKGHFGNIELPKLVDCLRRLGHDVEVVIKPLPENASKPGAFTVTPGQVAGTR